MNNSPEDGESKSDATNLTSPLLEADNRSVSLDKSILSDEDDDKKFGESSTEAKENKTEGNERGSLFKRSESIHNKARKKSIQEQKEAAKR